MQYKSINIYNLKREDLSSNSIWVDSEYAEEFGADPNFMKGLDDDSIVEIPVSQLKYRLDTLRETGRYYAICEASFSDKSTYTGLAYIRAYDNSPYAIDVFYKSQRVSVPIHSTGVLKQDLSIIKKTLGKDSSEVYPLKIKICIEHLIEIIKEYELTS